MEIELYGFYGMSVLQFDRRVSDNANPLGLATPPVGKRSSVPTQSLHVGAPLSLSAT